MNTRAWASPSWTPPLPDLRVGRITKGVGTFRARTRRMLVIVWLLQSWVLIALVKHVHTSGPRPQLPQPQSILVSEACARSSSPRLFVQHLQLSSWLARISRCSGSSACTHPASYVCPLYDLAMVFSALPSLNHLSWPSLKVCESSQSQVLPSLVCTLMVMGLPTASSVARMSTLSSGLILS